MARTRLTTPTPVAFALPWRRNQTVLRLTKKILELDQTEARGLTDTLVQIGRRLRTIHAQLDHGQWLDWVEDAVPFARRTAHNYIALADWAEAEPEDYGRFKHLGPAKLYLLATLERPARRRLARRVLHVIPGSGKKKKLDVMTVRELEEVTLGFRDDLPPAPPIGRVVSGYRRRVSGVVGATDEIVRRRREIAREDVEELVEELSGIVDELVEAFAL